MDESTKCRGCRHLAWKSFHWCPAILLVALFLGCGGVVGSGPSQPPPLSISVTPASASVLLGEPRTFAATVSNSINRTVAWSVNDIPGGNAEIGTIDANGVYTSPGILPASASVTVRATSAADPSKSAAASVHITSDISLTVSPQGSPVELGSSQTFLAAVTSAGRPNTGVTWTVSRNGCAGASCGIVDIFGNYTAPQNLPASSSVSLTATSIADPSKSGNTTIAITSSFTLNLTGPSPVYTSTVVSYAAAVIPVANSNPSRTIIWSVSGAGCSGVACGTISASGVYSAPPIPPVPATVQITATPMADRSKAALDTVMIVQTLSVTVLPSAVTL